MNDQTVPSERPGFFNILLKVWLAPREGFGALVTHPIWIAPLLVSTLLSFGFSALWLSKVDLHEFSKQQLEDSGRAQRLSPDQREQVIAMSAKVTWPVSLTMGLLGAPLWLLLCGGYFLAVLRSVYGAPLSFRQSLSISAFANAAVSLVSVPLSVATFLLKGDWNVSPQEILQANLGLLLEKGVAPPWLYALASSLDLFTFWTIFLLAIGYGVAARRSTVSAVWAVVAPWVVLVLVRVGRAALFG